MADTAFKGIFFGYPTDSYGYLIYNPVTHRVIVLRHVRFDETFGGILSEEGPHPTSSSTHVETWQSYCR